MSHFLRESLAFWLLAAAVSLPENSWLFIGGELMGNMLSVVGCVLLLWAMTLVYARDTGISRACLLL